jgi:hypothetical protein
MVSYFSCSGAGRAGLVGGVQVGDDRAGALVQQAGALGGIVVAADDVKRGPCRFQGVSPRWLI